MDATHPLDPETPPGVSPQAGADAAAESSPASAAESSADASADASADVAAVAPAESSLLADQARLVLRRVKDPELNLNIVDLGLIYEIRADGDTITVDMSLTSPGCPSGPEIMGEAEQQLRTIPGVGTVTMNLVWSPPWTPERIEPRVRAYMGF